MGMMRLEDDALNSLGAGLVTGSLISNSLMSSLAQRSVQRWHIMALWATLGVAGHALTTFAGADRIPEFEHDPISMLMQRLAEPPRPSSAAGAVAAAAHGGAAAANNDKLHGAPRAGELQRGQRDL